MRQWEGWGLGERNGIRSRLAPSAGQHTLEIEPFYLLFPTTYLLFSRAGRKAGCRSPQNASRRCPVA